MWTFLFMNLVEHIRYPSQLIYCITLYGFLSAPCRLNNEQIFRRDGKTGQENTPLETEQTRAAILFSKISTSCIGYRGILHGGSR